MVFYNGLCFLTNGTIKSTVDYKLKGNATILNIKLKLGQGLRDYFNIFMVHFSNDISQTIQSNEMSYYLVYFRMRQIWLGKIDDSRGF